MGVVVSSPNNSKLDTMNVDKELFGAFAFYAGIVTIKMMVMSFLTARQRFKVGVFTSPEDATMQGHKAGVHEDVERVRRAHLNDMENVLPFLILGFLYMFTNPAYSTALLITESLLEQGLFTL